ncbi:response regulator [Paenibacillus rhizoplanae]
MWWTWSRASRHGREHGIEVAGTALDGEAGLRIIGETRPDIVLTDIKMPRMDGLQMTRAILEVLPDCKNYYPQRLLGVLLCPGSHPAGGRLIS